MQPATARTSLRTSLRRVAGVVTATLTALPILVAAAPAAHATGGATAAPPADQTFVVDDTRDLVDADPDDGRCLTSASTCTLRAAVQAANQTPESDRVEVREGTYRLSIEGRHEDLAATGDLDVRAPLHLVGAGAATTIVDGARLDRVLDVFATDVTIEALTVTGGSTETFQSTLTGPDPLAGIALDTQSRPDRGGDGGGVRVDGSGAAFVDVTITANRAAGEGGGLFAAESVSVTGGAVTSNRADSDGGGAFIEGPRHGVTTDALADGHTTFHETHIADNWADGDGGALYLLGDARLTGGEITGNGASARGGGLLGAGNLVVESRVVDNEAENGGGIATTQNLVLRSGTVAGNRATGDGAGVWADGRRVTILNTTLADNAASGAGGALRLVGDTWAQIDFSTFVANEAAEGAAIRGGKTDRAYDLHGYMSNNAFAGHAPRACRFHGLLPHANVSDTDGCGDVRHDDLHIVPVHDGGTVVAYAPRPGSPLVDAAGYSQMRPCAATAADQFGHPRPIDGDGDGTANCDVGAVELPSSTVP